LASIKNGNPLTRKAKVGEVLNFSLQKTIFSENSLIFDVPDVMQPAIQAMENWKNPYEKTPSYITVMVPNEKALPKLIGLFERFLK
jgi:hypothetical protein